MSSAAPLPFRQELAHAHRGLSSVSEHDAQRPLRDGGWSRKQIVGHLIDSALNNHQRFVRAVLDGTYQGPTYDQERWVGIHGYDSMPWANLLEHWRLQNELLCQVVDRIPEDRWEAPCRVGDNPPVTLGFLVQDYLVHLRHHIRQVLA